ncbi:MAG TPA: hypothetical protein VF057_06130 [Thermoanaerobaculia bacterium]
MATFLLVTTLVTIAGLIATSIAGFMATPAQAANHIMFALVTVVIGLFSQSMTLFFFIGTGKQLKDKVKDTANDAEVRAATRALTMKVSPAATYAMFVLMITFITGGGVGSGKTPRWLHDALTIASILMYARAYWVQIQAMTTSANLMERFLRD